jgi:hypothetical protein
VGLCAPCMLALGANRQQSHHCTAAVEHLTKAGSQYTVAVTPHNPQEMCPSCCTSVCHAVLLCHRRSDLQEAVQHLRNTLNFDKDAKVGPAQVLLGTAHAAA